MSLVFLICDDDDDDDDEIIIIIISTILRGTPGAVKYEAQCLAITESLSA